MILKQTTTYARKFLMVLTSDHITGATGKTVTVELSKGANAAGSAAVGSVSELDSANLPGAYQIILNVADVSVVGDLWFHCTASGCDPTDFVDQVQAQVFTDLVLNINGRVLIANNLQQNAALNPLIFPMTSASTGQRLSGLTVTSQRTLGSAGYAPTANSVTEIGSSGTYAINLNPSDINASTIGFLFTAPGANDVFIPLTPTP